MRTRVWCMSLVLASLGVACGDQPTEVVPEQELTEGPGVIAAATSTSDDGLSITTDKDDYAPGDTVWFTGAGWPANDVLDVLLEDDPATHPPHTWTITVTGDGTFRDSTYVVDVGDLGVTFTLTATSRATGRNLSVTFTDGNVTARTNSSTLTIAVSWRRFNTNTTCTNPPTTIGSVSNVSNSVTVIQNVVAGQSLEMTAPATTGGQNFVNWTSGSDVRTTTTICVPGAIPAQNWVANYAAPTDNQPPVVSEVAVNPSLTNGSSNVTLTAKVDDAGTGNSNIVAAAYTIDGGSPIAMTASDLAFDSPTENVTATILAASVAGLNNGEHTLCVRGTDAQGNTSLFSAANACTTLTVDKAAPIVSNVSLDPSLTNGSVNVSLTAKVDDASTGNSDIVSAVYSIDGGSPIAMTSSDLTFDSPTEDVAATIPSATVAGLTNGEHTICVQGTDAAGNTSLFSVASACTKLTVDKLPPLVASVQASPNPTNGTVAVTLTASVSDAGAGGSNIASAAYNIDGGSVIAMTAADGAFDSPTEGLTATINAPIAEGTYTLCMQGTDAAGNTSSFAATGACTALIVDRTPPAVSNFTVNPNPVAVNTSLTITAAFTDGLTNVMGAEYSLGGTGGPWTALPAAAGTSPYGNSKTEQGTITISLPTADVHDVCVRSTDQVNNTNSTTGANQIQCLFLAVYDPTAGFVTGGGWILYTAGSCTICEGEAGQGFFGFVSKYIFQKDKSTPVLTGNTRFEFHAGGHLFTSTDYEWLVVSGSGTRAQYKGTGQLDGVGGYGFLLTALDGTPDKFRIKIWSTNTNSVVFDNQMNEAESSNAATALDKVNGNGSIVIHVPKK